MRPVVVVLLGIYLLICYAVVAWAVRHAKKKGKTPWHWGAGAALVMYLIPFWDWLPTVAAHKYYCSTEAGFWVYKTVDQWKAENPGVMETLDSYNQNPGGYNVSWPSDYKINNDSHTKTLINHINNRFDVLFTQQDISSLVPIVRQEKVLLDSKRNEVVARYITFGSGNSVKNTIGPPGPLKFWLQNGRCSNGKEQLNAFGQFYRQFEGGSK